VDRIIAINEQDYLFSANTWWYLSWTDERAPAAVEAATAAASQPGASCGRLCNQQRAESAVSQCCDTLWLPSIVFRNIDEFPQGRVQPSYVDVSPDGVVSWRVEMRANFLTTLDVSAFPFDTQSLDIVATMSNYPGQGTVRLVPSATGLGIFTFGAGDDVSGWHAHDVDIFVRTPQNYSSVFTSEHVLRRQVSLSAPGDPAPLSPNNSPAALAARGGAPAPPRFGGDLGVVDLTISIGVTRLWSYFALNAILPVVICTSIAFLAFWVHPADLSTRLSLVVGLFLALVAIQYVIEGDLPRASYVLPTRRLVIASYVALALIAIETLVVANVVDWPRVRAYFQGQSRALARRAELKRAAMDWERSRRPAVPARRAGSASAAERGWGAALGRLATVARGGGGSGSGAGLSARGGGRSGASTTAAASPRGLDDAGERPPLPPTPPSTSLDAAEAQPSAPGVKTVQFPADAGGGGDGGPSTRRSPPPSRWPLGASGGLGGGTGGPTTSSSQAGAADGGRRGSEAVLLEADMEAGYFAWLAWVIDMASVREREPQASFFRFFHFSSFFQPPHPSIHLSFVFLFSRTSHLAPPTTRLFLSLA
jgi:hypothetical protein